MKLALISNGEIVKTVIADRGFDLPNGDRVSPAVAGWESGDYALAEIDDADDVPDGKISTGQTAKIVDGSPKWVHTLEDEPAPTEADVIAERERRLAAGFDYDFGDDRGVHHIGTTKEDMKGWDEVTKIANALMNVGNTTTTIHIETNTGGADVTAPEWNAILLYAGQVRQPTWQASFDIVKMDPIPYDYTTDAYWTAS